MRLQAKIVDYRTFETDAAHLVRKLLPGRSNEASIAANGSVQVDAETAEGAALDSAWIEAEAEGIISAWRHYVGTNPRGPHAAVAKKRIAGRESSGRVIYVFRGHEEGVRSVAIAPDGRAALSGGGDRILRLWDLSSGRRLHDFMGHDAAINCVAFAPDGRTALSGAYDGTVRLWDLATGLQIHRFAHGATAVSFAPDGSTALSAGYGGAIHTLDVASRRETRVQKHPYATSVAITPDGRLALSGGTSFERRFLGFGIGRSRTLRLWDLVNGCEVLDFAGETEPVNFVAVAPDGRTALSGYLELVLSELPSGQRIRAFGKGANSAAFSPDGRTALSANFDQSISLWELASGREIHAFSGHADAINSVAFAPDGRTALSGSSDKTLRLWDLTGL